MGRLLIELRLIPKLQVSMVSPDGLELKRKHLQSTLQIFRGVSPHGDYRQ